MNQNLKSAIIGGGSIGSILGIFALTTFATFYMLGGGYADHGPGVMAAIMIAISMLIAALAIGSWIVALIDSNTNPKLTDENRKFWLAGIALLGIWILPFYWFKYVR